MRVRFVRRLKCSFTEEGWHSWWLPMGRRGYEVVPSERFTSQRLPLFFKSKDPCPLLSTPTTMYTGLPATFAGQNCFRNLQFRVHSAIAIPDCLVPMKTRLSFLREHWGFCRCPLLTDSCVLQGRLNQYLIPEDEFWLDLRKWCSDLSVLNIWYPRLRRQLSGTALV